MPAARGQQWPTSGDRLTAVTLQYATPTTDAMGGRGEPAWTDVGRWWVKVTVTPIVSSETPTVLGYQCEGPFRRDLLDYFLAGTGLRLVSSDLGLTLKVFQVENPQLRKKTLVAHCANAVNTP